MFVKSFTDGVFHCVSERTQMVVKTFGTLREAEAFCEARDETPAHSVEAVQHSQVDEFQEQLQELVEDAAHRGAF